MSEINHKFPSDELLELRYLQHTFDPSIEFVPPLEVLEQHSEEPEPTVNEKQQLLRDVIGLRPDAKVFMAPVEDEDKITVADTYRVIDQLHELPNTSPTGRIRAIWARRAAYYVDNVPFEHAADIHQIFEQALKSGNTWVPLAAGWARTTADTDPRKLEIMQEISKLIARDDTEVAYVQAIMSVSFAQIAYSQDLARAHADGDNIVTADDAQDESLAPAYADRFIATPHGLDGESVYAPEDLVKWNSDEWESDDLLHIDQKQPDVECIEPTLNVLGEIHRSASRAFADSRSGRFANMLASIDTTELAFLINIDELKDHMDDLLWVRRFMYDRVGMSLDDDGRDASQMYTEDCRISDEEKQERLRTIVSEFDDDILMSQTLDEGLELVYPDLDRKLRRHYKTAAAITLAQIRHLQKIRTIMPDMSDESLNLVPEQLAEEDESAPVERGMTGPVTRTPTEWPAEELLHDTSKPYDEQTNNVIVSSDESLIENITDEQMATFRMLRAESLRNRADQDIQTMEGLRSWFSNDMARKILHVDQPTKEQAALAHRARSVVFDLEGISHDAGIVGHIHNVHDNYGANDTYKGKWHELAATAREVLSNDPAHVDKLEKLETVLALLADTPDDLESVRNYAYLTLLQINKYRQMKADATANN